MPLYEYRNKTTGDIEEWMCPVNRRDDVPDPYERVPIPAKLAVRRNLMDPGDPDVAAPKAFKDLEEKMGAAALSREVGFSPEQIRKIWGIK